MAKEIIIHTSTLDRLLRKLEKGIGRVEGGTSTALQRLRGFLEGLGYKTKGYYASGTPEVLKVLTPRKGRLAALLRSVGGKTGKIVGAMSRHPSATLLVPTGVVASYLILRKLMKKD